MTDELDDFQRMASRARADCAPKADVARAVMARIDAVRPAQYDANRLLAACSCLAALAAAIAVATASWAWFSWNDPLVQVFSQAHLVMQ
jgi:hypothetical protein